MTLASPLQSNAALAELRAAARRRLARSRPAWRPLRPTQAQEGMYRSRLLVLVQACEAQVEKAVRGLLAEWPEGRRVDAPPTLAAIEAAVNAASAQIATQVGASLSSVELTRMFLALDRSHQKAMRSQFNSLLGVDVLAALPPAEATAGRFVKENVKLISSIPQQYLEQVQGVLSEALAAGAQGPKVQQLLRQRFEVTRGRAEKIVKDQMGKYYGQLSAERNQQLGVRRFRWRTMGDSKVRPEHVALNNRVFEYSNPPSEGLPGVAILCRCFAEPLIEDLL